MYRSRTLVLWCVSAVLLLSACGGDDPQPRFAAETSAAAESASPSPSESAVPKDETPEEFIRRWNELDYEMHNTGETEAFLAVSSKCEPCRGVADTITQYYKAGGSLSGGRREITRIEHIGGDTYDVWFDVQRLRVIEKAGAKPTVMKGGKAKFQFVLNPTKRGTELVELYGRPL